MGGAGAGDGGEFGEREGCGLEAERFCSFDAGVAFLGLEGADGVDQAAAWAEEASGGCEKAVLAVGQGGDVTFALEVKDVGVAADGAGGGAGGV